MARILLAPIGRSPGAVTGIYYALRDQSPSVEIDAAVLVATAMEYVQQSAEIVKKTLGSERVIVLPLRVEDEGVYDFRDEATVLDFIHQVNAVLEHARRNQDEVYIGISGGRSSMGALATLSAYIYGAAGVYHLWVQRDIERQGDITTLRGMLPSKRVPILHPPADKRRLVTLPLTTFDQFWSQGWLSETLAERTEVREALLRAVTRTELRQLELLREKRAASFDEVAAGLREIFQGTEIEEWVELGIKVSGGDSEPVTRKIEDKPYIQPDLKEQIRRALNDLTTYTQAADRLLTFVEKVATPLAIGFGAAKFGIQLS